MSDQDIMYVGELIMKFDDTLNKIRRESIRGDGSIDTIKRGFDFEKLMVRYLKEDSLYKTEYTNTKQFNEWYSETDTGIDIIA